MKQNKFFSWILCAAFIICGASFTSCSSDDKEDDIHPKVDETLLIGCWENDDNGECWQYKTDHTGVYWDPAETTYEQASTTSTGLFQWYIDESGLMHLFYMETTSGYDDPDPDAPYVIKELSATHMTYQTSGGAKVHLTKFTLEQ